MDSRPSRTGRVVVWSGLSSQGVASSEEGVELVAHDGGEVLVASGVGPPGEALVVRADAEVGQDLGQAAIRGAAFEGTFESSGDGDPLVLCSLLQVWVGSDERLDLSSDLSLLGHMGVTERAQRGSEGIGDGGTLGRGLDGSCDEGGRGCLALEEHLALV